MHDTTDIEWLRRYFAEFRLYATDSSLKKRIGEWIDESSEKTDADSAAGHVQTRLSELQAENEMYHTATTRRGEDCFPDACQGCPHYGSACPVLSNREERQWRERKLDDAESEQDARRVFAIQATDTGCVVIPKALAEWESGHSEFVDDGFSLYRELSEHLDRDTPDVTGESDGIDLGLDADVEGSDASGVGVFGAEGDG